MKLKNSLPIAALACLGIAALVFAPKASHAQAPPDAGTPPATGQRRGAGRGQNPVIAAFKSVSPTSDEQAKFDALTATYQTDLTAAGAEPDAAEMRKKQAAVRTKYRSDVEALLTPDQLTKFKVAVVVPPIMRNLDTQLMLTDDEKTKIEPILDDYAVKSDGLKGAEARALTADTKTKIRAVLTPDQQPKLDAMRNLAGGGGRRGGAAAPTAPPVGLPPATTPPVTPPATPPVTPPTTPPAR